MEEQVWDSERGAETCSSAASERTPAQGIASEHHRGFAVGSVSWQGLHARQSWVCDDLSDFLVLAFLIRSFSRLLKQIQAKSAKKIKGMHQ